MSAKVLLITGATGKQGGAVIDALLKYYPDRFYILAVTRNALGPGAKRLLEKSSAIRIVEGDLDDVPHIFAEGRRIAGQPIWGVYSVQVSMGKDVTVEREVRQGHALVDEAIKTGVEHFVYSSVERGGDVESWNNPTPIPHFRSKYHIEHYLQRQAAKYEGKMGWTILRPVAVSITWSYCRD